MDESLELMRDLLKTSLSRILLAIVVSCAVFGDRNISRAETSPSEPILVVQNGKYGYIDHQGKIVIRPQFYWGVDFWQGLAEVYVCGRTVSVDKNGIFHPRRIALAGELSPKRVGEKVGFEDGVGQFKIPAIFDEALPFSEGFAAVQVDNQWGFIDTTGQMVIRPRFAAAFYFREGVGTVDNEQGTVLIDKSGNVISSGYNTIDFIADGRAPVLRVDKWGFLDLQGKVVIPIEYDSMRPFSGGLAPVQKDDKWGYIDRDGKIVIPFQFDEADSFASGLAPVKLGEDSGFIDKSGKFAFHLNFKSSLGFFGINSSGLDIADSDVAGYWTDDGRFGYVNTSGKVIWEPTAGGPSDMVIGGETEAEKVESCKGMPQSVQEQIASFPDD